MITTEKINELKSNEAFMNSLSAADNVADVKNLFEEYGVEITEEELEDAYAMANEAKANGELSEEALQGVAGGCMGAVLIGWGGIILYLGATNMKKKYRR